MIRTLAALAFMVLTVWLVFEYETAAQEQPMRQSISDMDKP